MTHKVFNKKKELNQNKKNITQQFYAIRRKYDDVKRKRFSFLHVNYLFCNDDRTEKRKIVTSTSQRSKLTSEIKQKK